MGGPSLRWSRPQNCHSVDEGWDKKIFPIGRSQAFIHGLLMYWGQNWLVICYWLKSLNPLHSGAYQITSMEHQKMESHAFDSDSDWNFTKFRRKWGDNCWTISSKHLNELIITTIFQMMIATWPNRKLVAQLFILSLPLSLSPLTMLHLTCGG